MTVSPAYQHTNDIFDQSSYYSLSTNDDWDAGISFDTPYGHVAACMQAPQCAPEYSWSHDHLKAQAVQCGPFMHGSAPRAYMTPQPALYPCPRGHPYLAHPQALSSTNRLPFTVMGDIAPQYIPSLCQWAGCNMQLDDLTHAGIRRHFKEHHNSARGTLTKCQWGGGTCRSEEMLFENIPKHIAECHLRTMAMSCDYCGNTFARKDTLKRHLNSGCPAYQQQQFQYMAPS